MKAYLQTLAYVLLAMCPNREVATIPALPVPFIVGDCHWYSGYKVQFDGETLRMESYDYVGEGVCTDGSGVFRVIWRSKENGTMLMGRYWFDINGDLCGKYVALTYWNGDLSWSKEPV